MFQKLTKNLFLLGLSFSASLAMAEPEFKTLRADAIGDCYDADEGTPTKYPPASLANQRLMKQAAEMFGYKCTLASGIQNNHRSIFSMNQNLICPVTGATATFSCEPRQ